MDWTDEDRTPPMRRIKYEVGHAISGYPPDNAPAYYTNLKHARAAAYYEVREYLDALGAYDDDGKRWPRGNVNHVRVSKEGPYKWRINFGMGGSRYVYVSDVDEALYFDANGEVWERKVVRVTVPSVPNGEPDTEQDVVTWEHLNLDY